MTAKLVKLSGINKAYPGVVALHEVDFALRAGEVRALLGKNGAGKSTLIKILAGAELPDTGAIEIAGVPVTLRSPSDGIAAGIATVHQELSIIPELSIAENIFLGRWRRRMGGIDWRRMNTEAQAALQQLGLNVDLRRRAGDVAMAERQLIEIARAVHQGARVVVLDEPTSSLVAREVEILMGVIRRLSAAGVGVIYISHRMDEIRRVAHSVSVMRDGRHLVTAPLSEMTNADIVALMLGTARGAGLAADVAAPGSGPRGQGERQDVGPGKALLSLRKVAVAPRIEDVTLEVRAGEVLGLAGVLGAGRTELLQAIAGLRPVRGGTMMLDAAPYRPRHLQDAMRAGIVMTPEDRRGQGAVTLLGIDENLVMSNWSGVSSFGVINRRRMDATVQGLVRELGIKLFSPSDALSNLSGGNQQKVVIGKALNARPRILLLDEPTRGVDVGAKQQLYRLMRKMAAEGIAVVFVSGELEEFPEVCDRVVVLRGGRNTAELTGAAITTTNLLDKTLGQ